MTRDNDEFEYDVALSFAGEDRAVAEEFAKLLVAKNIKVFYVVDPKNWTLPVGVELTRKEVYNAQETQKF